MKYKLIVKYGYYEANSLFGLLWQVFKHRLHHFFNGDGWVD
jgi:hypothetical protein